MGIVFVYVGRGCAMEMGRQAVGVGFLPLPCGSWGGAQLLRLVGNCLHPLNHLASLNILSLNYLGGECALYPSVILSLHSSCFSFPSIGLTGVHHCVELITFHEVWRLRPWP